jgi:hypothetical protein
MSHVGSKGEWMMNRVTSKFLPVLVALVALLVAGRSQAAVITMTYVNGQISSTSNFAAGTVTNLANLSSEVQLPVGQFFRFGVALSVNNPNPEFGTQYATDANANYGVVYPAHLGFQALGMSVNSTDAGGVNLAPLLNGTKTRVVINGTPWPGAQPDAGDVTGGIAGSPSSIFRGLSPAFDPTTPGSVSALGTLGAPGANFINSLPYGTGASAIDSVVTLTPNLVSTDVTLWGRTQAGVDVGGTEANFAPRALAIGTTDSLVAPAGIAVHVIVPEPASIGVLGVSLLGLLARRRVA